MQQKQHVTAQQPPKAQNSEKTQNHSSDSMSSAANGNGPRVSFNRDVHVKRIGARPNESNYPEYDSTNLRREPPDLSEDALRREAALILKQAEFTNKHRGGRANEPGHGKVERKSQGKKVINNNPHFNSLPTRGKKKTKVVSRSVSDASAKKHKKPSVFNLFSRKSDQNLDKLDNNKSPKKVTRSKSDVGTGRSGRRSSTENDDSSVSKKKAPLSPIIEASPRDDYFVGRSSPPLFQTKVSDKAPITDTEPLVNPTKPISETIKSAIADLSRHSKSLEEMHLHSSQQPTKARLTKGMTVDGMVKRLSMERFSPPPTDQAFSYIRPKDQIIYAQVVCNNDGNNKQTVHQEFDSSFSRNHSSHFNQVTVNNKTFNSHDVTDSPTRREKNNYSDEDEGLGNEPKKYFFCEPNSRNSPKFFNSDEEFKSLVDDTPITPNFRNVAPEKYLLGDRPRGDGCEFYPEFNDLTLDLARRRQMLESRMRSRIGSRDMLDTTAHDKEWLRRTKRDIYREPERIEQIRRTLSKEFLGATPEPRRLKSISPEHSLKDYTHRDWSRSHLDIASPVPEVRTSKLKSRDHGQHKTQVAVGKFEREVRKKERLHSPDIDRVRDVDDHDADFLVNRYHTDMQHRRSTERVLTASPDNTLQRQKKVQKSFDKGDSGIENDYRKDSFNNHSKFRRKRTVDDDIIDVEKFLKLERAHTQVTHVSQFIKQFGNPRSVKERSIDDGSRFDPRLDKYLMSDTSTLRRGQQRYQPVPGVRHHEKKISGLEKVKQLFTGSLKRNKTKPSAKPVPIETDSLSRYREYRGGSAYHDSKVNVTSPHRPRLSTPRGSPVVSAKRTQSFMNSSKSSSISTVRPPDHQNTSQKTGWFKSLDRLTARKKPQNTRKVDDNTMQRNKPRPLSPRNEKVPSKNLRYFGDTDLESVAYTSKEMKPKADKYNYKSRHQSGMLGNSKISQSAYNLNNNWDDKPQMDQKHTPVKFQKSISLENIDRDSSLKTKRNRNKSRSRELHDISESLSASDTDLMEHHQRRDVSPPPNANRHHTMKNERNVTSQRTTNRTAQRSPVRESFGQSYRTDENNLSFEQKRHVFEDNRRSRHSPSRERSQERTMFPYRKNYEISLSPNGDARKPPPGRTLERQKPKRRTVSRERDRERDSSGTEGESSLQSQRNVVFLHATTVGEIPSSYRTERPNTKTMSREDLSKKPSTRSVSRSISVLAPWKPKHISEGFEINYAQDENKYPVHRDSRTPSSGYNRHLPPPGSSATMLKKNKKVKTLSRSKSSLKDDRFSEQSSSFNSSSNRQYRDYRNTDSLSRRK